MKGCQIQSICLMGIDTVTQTIRLIEMDAVTQTIILIETDTVFNWTALNAANQSGMEMPEMWISTSITTSPVISSMAFLTRFWTRLLVVGML